MTKLLRGRPIYIIITMMLAIVATAVWIISRPRPFDGTIAVDGWRQFPLGLYIAGRDYSDAELIRWRDAGINIIGCLTVADLQHAERLGLMGWFPYPLKVYNDSTEALALSVIDSAGREPALAVWHGPDEEGYGKAWFPATRTIAEGRFDWCATPQRAHETLTRLDSLVDGYRRGHELLKRHDKQHPLWLNDVPIVSELTLQGVGPFCDVLGFDYYPVSVPIRTHLDEQGLFMDRYHRANPTKPIWTVQQGFSWANDHPSEYRRFESTSGSLPPSYNQMRFLAWQSIAHGASGLFWWGAHMSQPEDSLLADVRAVVGEIAQYQDFLIGEPIESLNIYPDPNCSIRSPGWSMIARRHGSELMLVIVNEQPRFDEGILAGIPDSWYYPLNFIDGFQWTAAGDHKAIVCMGPQTVRVVIGPAP